MADYPKASKELQEQQQSTLDLIAVQLQIANAQAGPTKDEFQKANTELLREMLEAQDQTDELIEEAKEGGKERRETIQKQTGWFTKLLDHFSWERDYVEAKDKRELRMASKVQDFGKNLVKNLESAAKGLFDLLLTGLGLFALYKLFEWLAEQDFEQLYNDVVQFATDMLEEFDLVVDAFLEVGGLLARMTGIFWAYYLFSKFDSWKAATTALSAYLDKFSFDNLFGKDSKIRNILRRIRSMFGFMLTGANVAIEASKGLWTTLFGPESKIRGILTKLSNMFGFGATVTEAATDIEVKKGLWTTLFGPDSKIRKLIRTITNLFSFSTVRKVEDAVGEAKDMWRFFFGYDSPLRRILRFIGRFFGGTIKFAANFATGGGYSLMFGPEGGFRKLMGFIGSFFGGEGKLVKAFTAITTNPTVQKVIGFLKNIGKNMLKFLGPVTWLIAGYDAIAGEGGFMDAFNKTEGSLWDKTVAGLSAAVNSLVDFFVFDTVQLIEDFVKWSIKKLAGLFGIEESDVEGADWYKFSITGFLAESFSDYLTFLEGIFTFDTEKMKEGLSGLWGKFKGLGDWLYGTLVAPAIKWAAGLLGIDIDEEAVTKFKPIQWIEDNFLSPMFDWLEGLFSMDFDAMAKSLMPSWLYNFFSGSGGEKVTEDLFASGGFIDDYGMNSINEDEIRKMIDATSGDDQKKLMNQLVAAYRDNTANLESAEQEKLKLLLNEYGASLNRGGYIPPGMSVPAVLHGPEVVAPLKQIPTLDKPANTAPIITNNSPVITTNSSSSPTSVIMGVSTTDPNKAMMQG